MKKLFKFIGLIFKGIWKGITFVRLALANLLFLLMLAVFTLRLPTPEKVDQ